ARVFLPGLAAVVAVSDAFAPAGAGESRDDRRIRALLKAARVVGIDDRAARETPVMELFVSSGDNIFSFSELGMVVVSPELLLSFSELGMVSPELSACTPTSPIATDRIA